MVQQVGVGLARPPRQAHLRPPLVGRGVGDAAQPAAGGRAPAGERGLDDLDAKAPELRDEPLEVDARPARPAQGEGRVDEDPDGAAAYGAEQTP
jgi:hypothetical protein